MNLVYVKVFMKQIPEYTNIDFNYSNLYYKFKFNHNSNITSNYFGRFFHYTDIETIIKIADDCEFHFTRSDCLSDVNEGKDVIRIFKSVCLTLFENNDINEKFYLLIKNLKPRKDYPFIIKDLNKYSGYNSEYKAYIGCFSKNPNSKNNWSNFTNGISCAIEFYDNQFLIPDNKIITFCKQVIYDDIIKTKIIEDIIISFYNIYDIKYDEKILNYIETLLSLWQFIFKDNSFNGEKEVRLILFLPLSVEIELINNKNIDNNIKFYIKVPFNYFNNQIVVYTKTRKDKIKYYRNYINKSSKHYVDLRYVLPEPVFK